MEIIFTATYGFDQLDEIAQYLYQLKDQCQVYTFTGSLGAGKTTLVQALLKKFRILEPIVSPTFTYVNCYENTKGQLLYHFDCYRITSVSEFIEQGFDEYLYQPNSWAFIEWPEVIMPLLTKKVCHITIEYNEQDRKIEVETCE